MLRLLHLANEQWFRFDGEAASRSLDPVEMPIERFLNYVYWWATHKGDEQAVRRFDARLWQPVPGDEEDIPKESPWSPERENAALASLARNLGIDPAGPKAKDAQQPSQQPSRPALAQGAPVPRQGS